MDTENVQVWWIYESQIGGKGVKHLISQKTGKLILSMQLQMQMI
jgi:hypothetical protein